MSRLLIAPFLRWAGRLRHPALFKLIATLFLINLVVPDIIPFIDEILLGLATLALGNWKSGRVIDAEPIRDPRR